MADSSRQFSIADESETQDTTAQSMLSSFRILPSVSIDMSLLDEDLGPDPPELHRNSWVVGRLQDYTNRNFIDEDLFALYCQDFNDWSTADFNSLPSSMATALRDFLYRRGIYTGKKRGSPVADQLYNVLTTEDDPEWPEEALRRAQLDPGSVAFEMKQLLQQKMPFSEVQVMYGYGKSPTTTTSAPMTTSTTPISTPMSPTPAPTTPMDKGKTVQFDPTVRHPATVPSNHGYSTDTAPAVHPTIEPSHDPNTPSMLNTTHTQFPTSYQFRQPSSNRGFSPAYQNSVHTTLMDPHGNRIASVAPPEAITTLPAFTRNQLMPVTTPESVSPLPADIPNEPLDRQSAITFQKTWKEKDSYTGEMYDVLDDRVREFVSKCCILDIKPSQYAHVFRWALEGDARDFCRSSIPENANFWTMYLMLKAHFDTEVNHSAYHNDFSCLTWESIKSEPENAGKPPHEVLKIMLKKLRLCQRALGQGFAGENHLILAVTRAVKNSPEFDRAMDEYHASFQILCSKLRTSLTRYHERATRTFATEDVTHRRDPGTRPARQTSPPPATHLVDRKYNSNNSRSRQGNNTKRPGYHSARKKRCWICGKEGHFSTQHSRDEQEQHKDDWRRQRLRKGEQHSTNEYSQFLAEVEGEENCSDDDESEDAAESSDSQYFAMTTTLANRAFTHHIAGEALYPPTTATHFFLDRYSNEVFQGIIPDTGAAENSTAGLEQYKALKRETPSLDLDQNQAGRVRITFGNGKPILSIGSVTVKTPIGTVEFHILDANTPFLLCLRDLDRLHFYLNNVTNELVNDATNTRVPVIRKWGHPWFFLAQEEASIAFLTETELRRLHKRFGHPSVAALHNLLQKAGHEDADHDVLAKIQKFCHHCQLNSKAPVRFKFTLRDDQEFNYRLIVDVMYLDSKPVLHVIDDATAFQAGRFLRSLSAADTWEALKACWIDTYLGPPDIIRHDPGTNFAAAEFRLEAWHLGITCEQAPVEAHWAVGKVERYHAMIRRAYTIFKAELPSSAPESLLQMAFKAVNDTAGPNGLVPTLLVFGAYPRVNFDSPPSALTVQRAAAVNKAMVELRKLSAQRKVNDALNTRNGPDVTKVLPPTLELGSEVRVYRERGGWIGPYKVLAVAPGKVTIDMANGPVEFAATHIQPYNRSPDAASVPEDDPAADTINVEYPEPVQPRRRGRPRKNAAQHLVDDSNNRDPHSAYISTKESIDRELSIELRRQGKITTPGAPFEESDAVEIDGLMTAGVLKPELYKVDTHSGIRIFKSRMVREVKNQNTDNPYEKSRLVVQGYGDDEKKSLLTQSPTIQRCSQRVILALAPTLTKLGMMLALRDISQAYIQSNSKLEREVVVRLPSELKEKYPEGTLLRIMKPLYGIAEAGLHWYATYQQHHQEKLHMTATAYDPCLLVTAKGEAFGVAGLQTDDTLLLGTEQFLDLEEEELQKAKFRAKPRTPLGPGSTGDFNGCRLTFGDNGTITVVQKGQADRIELAKDAAQYVEQRARGAYISSVCQPEAAFDFSVAAQAVDPSIADYKQLNERLQWQIDNKLRGLRFIPLDLSKSKLIVFADGSFANNKDMSSQIGFVICLATEEPTTEGFTITGNILHWQSSKCKRVTRSVLASEIYGLVNGFDIAYVIGETLRTITQRLNLPPIPLVVCTDSYSLYDCLVKLGTTTEKRLMIDLQALRQSYERREISEIRWISGEGNPADSMTKGKANRALEKLVDNNKLTVKLEAWVDRRTDKGKDQGREEDRM